MPYLKGETPSHLESYVPQIITAFVNSRMELVGALLRSSDTDIDDPLADDEQVRDSPKHLPLPFHSLHRVMVRVARS